MKVCLSSRLPSVYLEKADEIRVQFRDRRSLPDLFDKYPEKTIILEMPFGTELDEDFNNDLKN